MALERAGPEADGGIMELACLESLDTFVEIDIGLAMEGRGVDIGTKFMPREIE